MSSTTKPVKYVGLFTMIAGLILLLTGGIVWGVITSELAAEKITVSADSAMLAGDDVNNGAHEYFPY